ncbi:MAG TPA: maleylpyruvate isomerase family mycothiol-dependent enzyme [Pseudonocardia sp.]|jgi:uncharacterized protein (TIGR03083 family)|nr:maleylpyruvate isomerase family mycothiol-dependent enzyme [Pseudonocardia sp.]
MSIDWTEALRRECAEMTRFCRELSVQEWRSPSAAPGWRIQDVVAHVGGALHALFTPASLKLVTTKDIERTNDEFVEARYTWTPAEVLGEFERWQGRVVRMAGVVTRTPAGRMPLPIGELGSYPLSLILGGALVFDQHTHLRHDMAPALGRPVPATDDLRMSAVLAWMFAVLANQLRAASPAWLDRPLSITLDGPGGGTWRIGTDGAVEQGAGSGTAAQISGASIDFPSWATCRTPWRTHDLKISGDEEYGARFLDAVNVV